MARNQVNFNMPKGIVLVPIAVFLLIFIAKSTETIGPGEAGVIFERFGDGINTEKTYGEGFHVVAPWNEMIVMKVRQQSVSDQMNVLSVNGLEVRVDGTVWLDQTMKILEIL